MAPAHCGLLKGFKKCCWENEPDVPFRKMWSRAKWQEQMGKLRFLRGLGAHAECKVCSLGFLRNQISVRWVLCRGTSSGGKAGGWNVLLQCSFCLLLLLVYQISGMSPSAFLYYWTCGMSSTGVLCLLTPRLSLGLCVAHDYQSQTTRWPECALHMAAYGHLHNGSQGWWWNPESCWWCSLSTDGW